jgi:hypothetical protein
MVTIIAADERREVPSKQNDRMMPSTMTAESAASVVISGSSSD